MFCCLTWCFPDYPVLSFHGKKKVVLSNVSWMGGKNEFLGIAYLVIGSMCVVMSIVMLIVYAKFKFPEEDWASRLFVFVFLRCKMSLLSHCRLYFFMLLLNGENFREMCVHREVLEFELLPFKY